MYFLDIRHPLRRMRLTNVTSEGRSLRNDAVGGAYGTQEIDMFPW